MVVDSLPSCPPGGWPLPRSLYVHVPFCRHRCGYCNFSVIAGRDDLQDRFLDAIEIELQTIAKARSIPIALDTLYLGGGTPTELTDGRLERLLDLLDQHTELSGTAEFTAEANPEDINEEVLSVLAHGGVNRISLGVQSFNDSKLKILQRGHTHEQAIESTQAASDRIGNVSIDLIFGAPDETADQWKDELDLAASLPIQHVSTYSLTYEKGTEFWSRRRRGELLEVSEDADIAMYQACPKRLRQAGFEHYEISSFAKPGYRSRHNSAYWNGHTWYAIGPGAARFVDGSRDVNHRSPTTYIKQMLAGGSATIETEPISLEQHAAELAAFGIRQIEGIDLSELNNRVGFDYSKKLRPIIEGFVSSGLLHLSGTRIRLSQRGLLLADMVETRILEGVFEL